MIKTVDSDPREEEMNNNMILELGDPIEVMKKENHLILAIINTVLTRVEMIIINNKEHLKEILIIKNLATIKINHQTHLNL
jgi:hypothetical protein